MPHDEQILSNQVETSSHGLVTGGRYRHYRKQQLYTIIGFGLLEATEDPAVIYRAEYGERLTWIRTVADFTARVEVDGQSVSRFLPVE